MEPEAHGELLRIPAVVDAAAARFAEPPLDREIARARGQFDRGRGAVCDDEELYPDHLAAFLEWYVLDRPQEGAGVAGAGGDGEGEARTAGEGQLEAEVAPPIWHLVRERPDDLLLRALALSQRGVFEVLDPRMAGPDGLRLLDLARGSMWRVDHEPMTGLTRGDIFEARILPWQGRVRFGPVFCFHPRPARDSIHALVSRARAEGWLGPELVDTLAQMRLKHSRCRNIPVSRIYGSRLLGGR